MMLARLKKIAAAPSFTFPWNQPAGSGGRGPNDGMLATTYPRLTRANSDTAWARRGAA